MIRNETKNDIIIEDNRTECPACEGSGDVDCRPGNSGDHEVSNDDGQVSCGRCGGVGYIELEQREFGSLKIGQQFLSEYCDRILVWRKSRLGGAVVHHDSHGLYTGCDFAWGLTAPVLFEK